MIFGIAVAAVVVAAVVLVLTLKPSSSPLLPADTPEGTVQRYIQDIVSGDFETAFSFLGPPPNVNSTYTTWLSTIPQAGQRPGIRVTLGTAAVTGDTATVAVSIDTFRPSGPFGSSVFTNTVTFYLTRTAGVWKITQPWEVYWFF